MLNGDIKPCPFCGSVNVQFDKCTSRVRCKNCFCTSGLIARLVEYSKINDDDAPLLAWNTRWIDGDKKE